MSDSLPILSFKIIPASDPEAAWKPIYDEAYRCWHEVWSTTLAELDGISTLFSDDFTRQHRVGCIFLHDRCIGVVFLRLVDFALPSSRADSYFKVWSKAALEQLGREGLKVAVGSNITVDPAFRGTLEGGIRLKNLLLGLCLKDSFDIGADVMTGTLRCNRGMRAVGQEFESEPLAMTFHHGVEVDLVAFYRSRCLHSRSFQYQPGLEKLWQSRTDFTAKQARFFGHQQGDHNTWEELR